MSQLILIQETKDPEDPSKILPGGYNWAYLNLFVYLYIKLILSITLLWEMVVRDALYEYQPLTNLMHNLYYIGER